jgi:hypothetical protein
MSTQPASGSCLSCGRPLPEQAGRGRIRHYCDATCRSAARRERQRSRQPATTDVKVSLTSSIRHVYLDGIQEEANGPAGLTARVTSASDQLVTQLSRTGAGSPLAAMVAARELSAVSTEALQASVDAARAAGHSWKEIGDVLQTTRQAAFQRFGRPVDPRTGTPMTKVLQPDAGDRTLGIFAEIAASRWEPARADFGERMQEAVSADRLADGWAQMIATFGAFERPGEPVMRQLGTRTVVDLPLRFEAGDVTGQVTFDADGSVAGLFIRPVLPQ